MMKRLAIVGRPNVGKSTLFNALRDVRGWRESSKLRRKEFESAVRPQLVSPMARTTRDVRLAPGRLGDLRFDLIDTAGYETEDDVRTETIVYGANWLGMSEVMRARSLESVETADAVLLVLDAVEGINGVDYEVVEWLRKYVKVPRLVVFNKCEFERRPSEVDVLTARQFVGKGDLSSDPIYLSAQHGEGFPDLIQALRTIILPAIEEDEVAGGGDEEVKKDEEEVLYPIRVALVGQPNVGKSSFLNAVAAAEISLESEVPGTTRDPVEYQVSLKDGKQIRLVDTAGVRGGSRRAMGRLQNRSSLNEIEAMACRATERELTRSADVVVLFVDAAEGRIRNDDKKLAQKCVREASGPVVVAATKVDLLMSDPELNVDVIERGVSNHLHDIVKSIEPYIVATSSMPPSTYTKSKTLRTRLSPYRVLDAVIEAYESFATRKLNTRLLNDWFRDWVKSPIGKPRVQDLTRIKFLAHTEQRPPTIALHGRLKKLHPKAEHALQMAIIHNFGLRGTRLHFEYKTEEPSMRRTPASLLPRQRVVGPTATLQRKAPAYVKANFLQRPRKHSSKRRTSSAR